MAHWGRDLLTTGRLITRFGTPTYDGQRIEVRATLDGSDLVAGVHPIEDGGPTDGQSPAAVLEASLAEDPADPPTIPAAARPATQDRPPASPETLAPGTVLGSFSFSLTEAGHRAYLADVRDEASPTADLGLVHPGRLLGLANTVLSETVLLGPWMHVGSTVNNHAPVAVGEEIEVRGVVTDNHDRKGHRFVDLDVVLLGPDGDTRAGSSTPRSTSPVSSGPTSEHRRRPARGGW